MPTRDDLQEGAVAMRPRSQTTMRAAPGRGTDAHASHHVIMGMVSGPRATGRHHCVKVLFAGPVPLWRRYSQARLEMFRERDRELARFWSCVVVLMNGYYFDSKLSFRIEALNLKLLFLVFLHWILYIC